MRTHKRFVRTLLLLLAGFAVFNYVVWHMFVRGRILNEGDSVGGDLVRMGYVAGSKTIRTNRDDLPRRHVERRDYRGGTMDVLTIGDSFSNGVAGGRNRYYQDYIASINNCSVLNIPQYRDMDSISTISLLLNCGYLERVKPKYVLISSSEKKCLEHLPEKFDFNRTLLEEQLEKFPVVNYGTPPQNTQTTGFFSEANFKFVRNSLLYRFSDKACIAKVYKARLDRPLFDVENPYTLLFYRGDIQNVKDVPAQVAKLNDALNTLSDRLAAKGIRLYFMPCVDKYNLYSGYIVNNKHPRSTFFEEMAKLPRRYGYIDTKAILSEELAKGVKDVFYADDTHWSWKASEKVFSTVRFM